MAYLPWAWPRLVALALLSVLASASNLFCFGLLQVHMKLQAAARKYDSDVDKISVDFKDVLTPTTVIMGAVIVIAFISAPTLLFLIQDMFHIVPKRIVRMLKMSDKTLSTSTLAYQAMGFALSTILLIVPLGFLTVSVFTKDARAVITQNGLDCPATLPPCTPIIYRDTQYIRINAELPWAVVFLNIVATVITFVAWCKRPRHIPNTLAISNGVFSPMGAIADGDSRKVESKEMHLVTL